MAHPAHLGHEQWPDNPLDAARDAFAWLTAGDHPIGSLGARSGSGTAVLSDAARPAPVSRPLSRAARFGRA